MTAKAVENLREVLYVDDRQLPEAITGNLNPENQNATRKGWRVVSAKGEINGSRHAAGGPTSPISDERSLPNWKAPSNTHSRGLSTVVAKLEISGEAR